jgi:hypothetical protein
VEDAACSLVTFDDYTCCGYGDPSYGDRVFILQQQITTDRDILYAAIVATPNPCGADGPEADMEDTLTWMVTAIEADPVLPGDRRKGNRHLHPPVVSSARKGTRCPSPSPRSSCSHSPPRPAPRTWWSARS